jgi:hypothetical protein
LSDEDAMKEQAKDPLFTTKGIILLALYGCIYAKIMFSMDPEWVGWAGPMALGALYVPNQPPPLGLPPKAVFEMGSLVSLLSLLFLGIIGIVRKERSIGVWPWFEAWLKKQGAARRRDSARMFMGGN